MVDLLDEAEVRTRVRERVNDRQWWILPWVSAASCYLSTEIEARFYTGEANADFETMMGSFGGVLVMSFAHKRRMSRRQYAELLVESGVIAGDVDALEETLLSQDIVISKYGSDDRVSEYLALSWHQWVKGDDGWKPVSNLN